RHFINRYQLVVGPDAGKVGGAAGCDRGYSKLLVGYIEGHPDPAEPVADRALIACNFGRSVTREPVERRDNAIEQSLVDLLFRKRRNGRGRRLRSSDQPPHQGAPVMGIVMGWYRVDRHLSPVVGKHDLWPSRARRLRDGKLVIEPGEPR